MLKTAEQLQKANARFNALAAAIVAAFAFSKDEEGKINAEDFSPIEQGVEELQKPAKAYRAALSKSLKLSDADLDADDAGAKIEAAVAAKDTKISELDAEKTRLTGELNAANAEVKRLKAESKSADELADGKSREIAARAGGNVQGKEAGAGDFTTDDAKKKAAGTPRAKLAAFFTVKE